MTMTPTSAKLNNAALPKPAAAANPVADHFLRLSQIIGSTESNPTQPAIVPVCKTTWWAGVKAGRFPKPVKLSPRVTVWRASEVFALIADQKGGK